MILNYYPCPGDHGGRVCGADLYPRLWAAMQRQMAPARTLPPSGWLVVSVSCAVCGTEEMAFRLRYSTEPVVVEVRR